MSNSTLSRKRTSQCRRPQAHRNGIRPTVQRSHPRLQQSLPYRRTPRSSLRRVRHQRRLRQQARHSSPNAAAPKVFMKYFFVNTKTGEKSGEMLTLVSLDEDEPVEGEYPSSPQPASWLVPNEPRHPDSQSGGFFIHR